MFSVEYYTMDRAERYTQLKEPYNRYLQEAVRRSVHPYHTHDEYHTMSAAGEPVRLSTHRLIPYSWGKDGGVPQDR